MARRFVNSETNPVSIVFQRICKKYEKLCRTIKKYNKIPTLEKKLSTIYSILIHGIIMLYQSFT